MTKSDPEPANELLELVKKEAKDRLLPEKGADFDIQYFSGEEEVVYGEKPYNWVNAVSEGLRVVCHGPEFRVSMCKQKKPMLPEFLASADGSYRRALRIAINADEIGNKADYYIHIIGELVVVSTEKLTVAQLVGDKSLTEGDRAIMDQIRGK